MYSTGPAAALDGCDGAQNNGCIVGALYVRIAVMHRHTFSDESKKKLWRPCREARALGL